MTKSVAGPPSLVTDQVTEIGSTAMSLFRGPGSRAATAGHVRPCAPVTQEPARGCLGRLTRPPRAAQRPASRANPRLRVLSAQVHEKNGVPR